MKSPESFENGIPTFRTGISDSPGWFASLREQLREMAEERRNPRPELKLTAKKDLAALDKLIEVKSPVASLVDGIWALVDDFRHPRKIETTAATVEVEQIWSPHSYDLPGLVSISVHVGAVALLLIPLGTSAVSKPPLTETIIALYQPSTLILNMPAKDEDSGGGGGGGRNQLTPPSLGKLPRPADKQFVPPDPEPPKNLAPLLAVEPTIVAPQLTQLPMLNLPMIGDPHGVPGPPSAGPGQGFGIGRGQGRGVGEGSGPGFGPGEGGGAGGGVYRVGGGITPPSVVHKVDPQYSEEARKAKYQGTVILEAIIRRDGTIQILRVIRSLGFGLDENAIAALQQWKFRPGTKNGEPVDVALNIEVNFNLR